MLPLIDTHQHLWELDQLRLPWLDGFAPLRRDYPMEAYLQAAQNQNVAKTIYMEVDVAPDQKDREVELVSAVCQDDKNPMVGAVFSGVLINPDFRDYVLRHRDNRYFKGIRQVLQVPEAQRGLCLEPDFVSSVRFLGEQGLLFSCCIRPAELEDAVALAQACPDTTIILDHCGNADPEIVAGTDKPHDPDNVYWHQANAWRTALQQLGACDNTICKISGIPMRATGDWGADELAPTVNHCLDSFAPDRVLTGGDWPVCTLGGSLDKWFATLREIISVRSPDHQALLLSANAERIYQV